MLDVTEHVNMHVTQHVNMHVTPHVNISLNKFVNSDGQWLLSFYKIVTYLLTQ